MYTLIPTVYRALLNSAVLGTDHRCLPHIEAVSVSKTDVGHATVAAGAAAVNVPAPTVADVVNQPASEAAADEVQVTMQLEASVASGKNAAVLVAHALALMSLLLLLHMHLV